MSIILLLLVVVLVSSGSIALGGQEQAGPLAGLVSYVIGQNAAELHHVMGLLMALAVGGHVVGVLVESWLMRCNLARSMITGYRHYDGHGQGVAVVGDPGRPRLALIIGTVCVGGGVAAMITLAGGAAGRVAMPLPVAQSVAGQAYGAECGACHLAYPPALLPAAAWSALMANLGSHFGEDASLDASTRSSIDQWLSANAAEHWDSKAAHLVSSLAAEAPYQITASPSWLRRHHELEDATFARRSIAGRGACQACHHDVVGRQSVDGFRRAAIAIP